ncbi:hypothetical protein F5876DRAFT_54212 [Lentinula aff. lateritia]|uniref:Uncharacterized protein n=1 Tax=Lentinula aff. lateritia TaxID=2804960 RepID=A0ACC1TGE6_9AGAR|nr:hypothetical protein F5876DRAFT_54212 [Lentinula aff. lateritia]
MWYIYILSALQIVTHFFQLPCMKPYPDEESVLIMDNCQIHHTNTLLEACNGAGICLFYA